MRLKFFLLLVLLPMFTFPQENFKNYFSDKSFRFDFILAGNYEQVNVYPQQMKQEKYWGGSNKNFVEPFNYGTYRLDIFDVKTNVLIFRKGFCPLFQEWQTTAEAKNDFKAFYQAALFPFPKKLFRIEIAARQKNGDFKIVYKTEINPDNYFIQKETLPEYNSRKILSSGRPEEKVDIVFVAEGYTENEKNKFYSDVERMTNSLFNVEPFKSEKNKFNISAIFVPSVESGTDVPGENIYKNTFFNSSFFTFDIPRYLSTTDLKTVNDVAATIPHDQICLLVNTDRYGGGGFYNFVSVFSAGHQLSEKVFIHEFSHAFAGLGDEYYTSDVTYENFYNLAIEPWESNLTTLVNFDKKWKEMISDSTPVPTPRIERYKNTVGVFEGGGYTNKGIYSPYMDCRMKTNDSEEFCPVCKEAILKVIEYYSE